MKPIDVKSNCYVEYSVDSNAKDAKFKIGDHARITKHKIFLPKAMLLICLKNFLWLVKSDICY